MHFHISQYNQPTSLHTFKNLLEMVVFLTHIVTTNLFNNCPKWNNFEALAPPSFFCLDFESIHIFKIQSQHKSAQKASN